MQVGIDIVHVGRIKKLYEQYKKRFLERVFSEREIAYCLGRKRFFECLAGRFAAKEAFYKALDSNMQKKTALKDIEILVDINGRPYYNVPLEPGNLSIALSISHEKEYAVAVCTIIRRST